MTMRTVSFGRTGLSVSNLCFGTMTFGGEADAKTSEEIYSACRDAGITFFDCANLYNGGRSEEILGDLIASERDELVITSKVGMRFSSASALNRGGNNRRHILMSVENSLRRLKTDRLDVLFLHRWDDDTPLEESLRALEDLVRAGKVIHTGVSNFTSWQTATALGIQRRNGWQAFDVIQPMYNLIKRQAEVEILPHAMAEGLAVISYGPNAGGVLTGKYRGSKVPEGVRLDLNKGYAKRYADDYYMTTASAFVELADEIGMHPVTLAVAWAAHHPAITCPIIGARNVEQLKPSLAAADFEMTDALYDRITALTRPLPSPTDRDEEG
ncbi:MAG: aldo/keto reductase [Alphaproteobacteria bacterium]